MKISITTTSFAQFSNEPLRMLEEAGISYILNTLGRKLSEDEVIDLSQDCVGIAAGTENLTQKVMSALPKLMAISRCGVGMDNVDLLAAERRGIIVVNTPYGPTLAVAELTLGLALDLMRQISRMDRELRSGIWRKRMGYNLKGKRLGIVGFGRIGMAVADVFAPLGVDVAYHDPVAESGKFPKMEMTKLLTWADILSLHCSRASDQGPLITREMLLSMKPGSWIINAARGGVVEESTICELITSGHLTGAAVDVFEQEPYNGPLKDIETAIITPHIGSYARESRIQMEKDTIRNLLEHIQKSDI